MRFNAIVNSAKSASLLTCAGGIITKANLIFNPQRGFTVGFSAFVWLTPDAYFHPACISSGLKLRS